MSFLADSVMKFLGYRAMRMFTYYHVSFFFLSGCYSTPICHVICHNPLQTVIAFIAVRHEKLWALACCLAQFSQMFGTQQQTLQNPKLLVDS